MAVPTPTTAKLMAIINTLQAQIVALQNAAPAAAAAPPAGAATMVFANTPGRNTIQYIVLRIRYQYSENLVEGNAKSHA
jgi:hypothetical protein